MPTEKLAFKSDPEPEPAVSGKLYIVHTDVYYEDENGKRYLLEGIVAKELE